MISEHHIDYDLRNQRKIWKTARSVAPIGDKNCWDIALKWGNFGEQNTPPLPSIPSWGVYCFLQEAQTSAQHYIEGVGGGGGGGGAEGGGKLHFAYFKLAKR